MNDLGFVEFSQTNFCFAAYHKPSKKWVYFEQDEEHPHLSKIGLTNHFEDAETFPTQWTLNIYLKSAYLSSNCEKNMEDFAVVKFKNTYTMVSNE